MTTVQARPHQTLLPPHPQLEPITADAYDNADQPALARWVDHCYAWHPHRMGVGVMPAGWPTLDPGELCPDCGPLDAARAQEHTRSRKRRNAASGRSPRSWGWPGGATGRKDRTRSSPVSRGA